MLSHEGDVGDAVVMEVSFDDWMANFRHDFGGIQVYCWRVMAKYEKQGGNAAGQDTT